MRWKPQALSPRLVDYACARRNNEGVDLDRLPPGDELWWRFAITAAIAPHDAESGFGYSRANQVLSYANGNVSVSIQRLYRGRIVLWGNTGDQQPRGTWNGIPGWATSDAVHASLKQAGATFLLWHARDGWESAMTHRGVVDVLAPVLSLDIDRATLVAARTGTISDDDLRGLGAEDPTHARALLCDAANNTAAPVQGTLRHLLASEIDAQMRMTPERDRLLPSRPVPLVRWAVAAKPPAGFTYIVRASRTGLIRTSTFIPPLPATHSRSLDAVLLNLYRDEAADHSGAWLFARVLFNGIQIHLDRAFDSVPAWASEAPPLEELAEEMGRRAPAWRPAWAQLLPHSGPGAV